jgi:lysozyme family protein
MAWLSTFQVESVTNREGLESNYSAFVERMIARYEGGYGWDPNDPGGPTKYGITCYDLAEFMHDRMDSMARWAPIVRAMSLVTADEIYADKYATACRFDDLGAGKDCSVFDFGVNSGPSRAVKYAQIIVGVTVDGVLGPVTLAAINSYDPKSFINKLCDTRLGFLERLSTWSTFGRGWSSRVSDLRAYSLALLNPKPMDKVGFQSKLTLIPNAFAKAYSPDDLR